MPLAPSPRRRLAVLACVVLSVWVFFPPAHWHFPHTRVASSSSYAPEKSIREIPHEALGSVESLFASLIILRDQTQEDLPALTHNLNMTKNLIRCMEESTCEPNQLKVVILGSQYFGDELRGWNGGEQIWARSVRIAMTNLRYTTLISMNDPEDVAGSSFWMYQLVPTLVKAIVSSPEWIIHCVESKTCIYHPTENPTGPPLWILFAFFFWTNPNHPLGPGWTLSPEPYPLERADYPPNYYLGYSVEPSCLSHQFVLPEKKKNQMYVMGKSLYYFGGSGSTWTADFYDEAAEVSGISFVVGASPSPDPHLNLDEANALPKSVVNNGPMAQKEFIEVLAHSHLLIGVGNPVTSPTPYEALCLGVPFLNPIKQWDHSDPWNRDKWDVQHGLLKLLDPPYVYNVHAGDKEGFLKAIKGGLENPLRDRFILERMKMVSLEQRVRGLVEADWKSRAREVLKGLKFHDRLEHHIH